MQVLFASGCYLVDASGDSFYAFIVQQIIELRSKSVCCRKLVAGSAYFLVKFSVMFTAFLK